MTAAATGFVRFAAPYQDDGVVVSGRLAVDQALGAAGRRPTCDTDGLKLGDLLSLGHQERHRAKRLAAEVHVEPGEDDAHAASRQLIADLGELPIKELGLVHRHNRGLGIQPLEDLAGIAHGYGFPTQTVVRRDLLSVIPLVQSRLENLDLLLCNAGPPDATDQLLRLAAEHTPANNLDPATVVAVAHEPLSPIK